MIYISNYNDCPKYGNCIVIKEYEEFVYISFDTPKEIIEAINLFYKYFINRFDSNKIEIKMSILIQDKSKTEFDFINRYYNEIYKKYSKDTLKELVNDCKRFIVSSFKNMLNLYGNKFSYNEWIIDFHNLEWSKNDVIGIENEDAKELFLEFLNGDIFIDY